MLNLNRAPAIIEESKRDWKFYQNSILKLDADRGKLLAEYKDGGAWKEHYKTWAEACVPLEISKRQADRLIEQHKVAFGTECPTESHKKEQASLSQIEKSREVATPEPEEKEEEEKPAVKVHTNGHKPKDNGKPKTELVLWKVVEEDIIGVGYRKVDDLNRQCPNPVHHKRMITALKMCHVILDEWRRDTK